MSLAFACHGPIKDAYDSGAEYLLERCRLNAACGFVQETYQTVVKHERFLKVCRTMIRVRQVRV
jgi:hypothetical protein